jgi:hypothetical protein
MTSIGLKTLNRKIDNVERQLINNNIAPILTTFEDIIINQIEKKKNNSRKEQLEKIKSHYTIGLLSQIDINNNNYIIDIIRYTVLWIESNVDKLLSALQSNDNSSAFKLESCLQLILEKNHNFDNEFLTCSINTMVDVMFNTKKKPTIYPVFNKTSFFIPTN